MPVRRTAIVHDWLDTWRGGENVLAEFLRIYPEADLYALVDFLSDEDRARLDGRRATTSFLQSLPFARTRFRTFLPLFPRAIESFDLSRYELIVSSSHAVAKGIRRHVGQLHVCYCYTPMRYAWDLREQYLEQTGLSSGVRGTVTRAMLDRLARWDRATADRVDAFIAISRHVADRIRRTYDRESTVIAPPVASPPALPNAPRRDRSFVTLSQLVPYKRVDLLVRAFAALPDRELLVIGEGPERAKLEREAPANVHFLGRVSDRERDRQLASARAFVFAAEEDFGIAPLEAQAHGTPVIAYARGGTGETIRGLDHPEPTGVLFEQQSADGLVAAISVFERHAMRISPDACRRNAQRFSPERFRREVGSFVDDCWQRWQAARNPHAA